jgi:hypothetical protein
MKPVKGGQGPVWAVAPLIIIIILSNHYSVIPKTKLPKKKLNFQKKHNLEHKDMKSICCNK